IASIGSIADAIPAGAVDDRLAALGSALGDLFGVDVDVTRDGPLIDLKFTLEKSTNDSILGVDYRASLSFVLGLRLNISTFHGYLSPGSHLDIHLDVEDGTFTKDFSFAAPAPQLSSADGGATITAGSGDDVLVVAAAAGGGMQ